MVLKGHWDSGHRLTQLADALGARRSERVRRPNALPLNTLYMVK